MSLRIGPTVQIPDEEIAISYILASGPGGQNVNKLATAAQLRFDARHSPSLLPRVRARLQALAGGRLTKDGVIVLTAQRFRSQTRNREDARERLADLIREALIAPVRRIATRPSRGEKRRRLESKLHRGQIKQGRSRPSED